MFERFTSLAKRAIATAQDAAMALGHDFIGTEHVLLGLSATAGTASEVLREQGIELDEARSHTVRLFGSRRYSRHRWSTSQGCTRVDRHRCDRDSTARRRRRRSDRGHHRDRTATDRFT